MIGLIGSPAIATQHARKDVAEQGDEDLGPARRGNPVHDKRRGDQRPEPAFLGIGPMAGLIAVEHRLVAQRLLEFLARRRDGVTRFFPRRLRTAQTDRDVQGVFQQRLHQPARHPTDHRQVRDQRRELRAELAGDGRRHRRLGRLPARRTDHVRTLILGDVRVDRRQFRDLMAAGLARHPAPARRQPMLAMPTRVRKDVDDRIHALGGHQWTTMAGMARLAARLAAALLAAAPLPLAACQARRTTAASTRSSNSGGAARVAVPSPRSVDRAWPLLRGAAHSLASVARLRASDGCHDRWTASAHSPVDFATVASLGTHAPIRALVGWL